ncbi:class I SAM-dependent methyltransferase [Jatrophihabitans sp. YIM 134969]
MTATTDRPSAPPAGAGLMFDNPRATTDSSLTFWTMAQTVALDCTTIYDVGCGRGAMVGAWGAGRSLHDLRAPGRHVVGMDVDPDAAANRVVDEFRLMTGGAWPAEDASADLVVADWVLEHVDDPHGFVDELDRVLRPGGVFLARTVSRWSPMALAARTVPQRMHVGALRRLQPTKAPEDTFPTRYRMNRRADLAALLDDRFTWTSVHRPGLDTYVRPWPALASTVSVVEKFLPQSAHLVLVVCARKRG